MKGVVLLDFNVDKNVDYFVCTTVRGNSKRISKLSGTNCGENCGEKRKGTQRSRFLLTNWWRWRLVDHECS